MIRIVRGAEPATLSQIRAAKLAALRALGRPPVADDVDGYRVVAGTLRKAQHYKCCYCEIKVQLAFNDVEHYRPKCSADRRPGCSQKHGYWWLAFTWENLLFACPACNRSGKNDRFPSDHFTISLAAEADPPGGELPLFLDPSGTINPVEHIEFVATTFGSKGGRAQWWARPRKGSRFGDMTVDVCKLNRNELLELRCDHYENVILPIVKALLIELASGSRAKIEREFQRALDLLNPKLVYVAFTYDVLCSSVPNSRLLSAIQVAWPMPHQVGV